MISWIKRITLDALIFLLIFYLLNKIDFNNFDKSKNDKLFDNILLFTSIFSAILITYIISKVFSIKQDRIERKKEIIELSNKVTDFRRIAFILFHKYGFWNPEMRKKYDDEYGELNAINMYNDFYKKDPIIKSQSENHYEFFLNSSGPMCGMDLYLDLRALDLKLDISDLTLINHYDWDKTYSLQKLKEFRNYNIGGNLWTCFDNRYQRYKNCFHFDKLEVEKDKIYFLANKINGYEFRECKDLRELLAKVGAYFTTRIIPRLLDLSLLNNKGLPNSLKYFISILLILMIFGIITPLLYFIANDLLCSTYLNLLIEINFSFLFTILIDFIIHFAKLMTSEIKEI